MFNIYFTSFAENMYGQWFSLNYTYYDVCSFFIFLFIYLSILLCVFLFCLTSFVLASSQPRVYESRLQNWCQYQLQKQKLTYKEIKRESKTLVYSLFKFGLVHFSCLSVFFYKYPYIFRACILSIQSSMFFCSIIWFDFETRIN